MNLLVCIGNVPDTTTKVKFADNKLDATGVQWIINPWDELALTRALELKESGAGIDKITVVTVGLIGAEATMRKALAIGADDAIRVDMEATDAYSTAVQIADIVKNGEYNIILTGLESADYNGVSVGGMLAELLDVASVSAVSGLNIEGGGLQIEREIDGGKEILSTETPVVLTVQKGITIDPRIPAMRGIMMARRKPLSVVPAIEVENLTEIVAYEMPESKGSCKIFAADDIAGLVSALKNEAKVI